MRREEHKIKSIRYFVGTVLSGDAGHDHYSFTGGLGAFVLPPRQRQFKLASSFAQPRVQRAV